MFKASAVKELHGDFGFSVNASSLSKAMDRSFKELWAIEHLHVILRKQGIADRERNFFDIAHLDYTKDSSRGFGLIELQGQTSNQCNNAWEVHGYTVVVLSVGLEHFHTIDNSGIGLPLRISPRYSKSIFAASQISWK